MQRHRHTEPVAGKSCVPVFDGLEKAGLAGKDIARIASVTPPTVSKWRCGRARLPARILVFLTLVLANRIDEMEALADGPLGWGTRDGSAVMAAHDLLGHQERLNRLLPADAVHEGARMFRHWWHAKGDAFSYGSLGVIAEVGETKVPA